MFVKSCIALAALLVVVSGELHDLAVGCVPLCYNVVNYSVVASCLGCVVYSRLTVARSRPLPPPGQANPCIRLGGPLLSTCQDEL